MRFAILGDHADGWGVALALAKRGHEIAVYLGSLPIETLRQQWPAIQRTSDLEQILSDPDIKAVIVASQPGQRLDYLRRVVQSERSALCLHPVDRKPDGAHEIHLLQGDQHQVVVPLLAEAEHPLVDRLRGFLHGPACPIGHPRLIELERWRAGEVLFENDDPDAKPNFPGWTLLRRLGGEIVEVSAFARGEDVERGEPAVIQGRFESGVLFRVQCLSAQAEERHRIIVTGPSGQAELTLTEPARLRWQIAGQVPEEGDHEIEIGRLDERGGGRVVGLTCSGYDGWESVAVQFEAAVERLNSTPRAVPGAGPAAAPGGGLNWLDEVRALELDASARRSIERRRADTLDFQEVNEDVGFKGTMTLVGCALIWLMPVLLVVTTWFPQLVWVVIPILLIFLGLQLLRWLVPSPR